MKTPDVMDISQAFTNEDLFTLDIGQVARRARLMLWTLRMMTSHLNIDDGNDWYVELSEIFFETVASDLERGAKLAEDVRVELRTDGAEGCKMRGAA